MYSLSRLDPSFCSRVNEFIEAAQKNAMTQIGTGICFSCLGCENNLSWKNLSTIKSHLIPRGFVKNYTLWIHHDESSINFHDDVVGLDDTYFIAICLVELNVGMGAHKKR